MLSLASTLEKSKSYSGSRHFTAEFNESSVGVSRQTFLSDFINMG